MTNPDGIERFLRSEFGWDVAMLDEVGRGAWSTAYRFHTDGRDLVIRVGRHVEDFEADAVAASYRSDRLPIPEVVHIGPFAEGHCCISTFAPGKPLEGCKSSEWREVVPSLVDALEAMRACRPSGAVRPWAEVVHAVDGDHVGTRLDGWRRKIARSPSAVDALASVMAQLRSIDLRGIEASLTHGDLINRNVHVEHGVISGVFDWGCLRWGDHLYDLAWFEFWSAWYPELDLGLLRSELDRRWRDAGYTIDDRAARERACLLHIGGDHLIYNAVIESETGLTELLDNMANLDLI